MGQIQRYHYHWCAAVHDQVGGFRIDVDVELGRWRGVAAFEQATAHEHDFAQARADFGRPTQGLPEIGQRPRAQRVRLPGALSMVVSMMKSTAWPSASGMEGSGRS